MQILRDVLPPRPIMFPVKNGNTEWLWGLLLVDNKHTGQMTLFYCFRY